MVCRPPLATRKLGSHHVASMFGWPRQGLLGALAVLQMLGMLGGRGKHRIAEAQAMVGMEVKAEIFSPQWVEEYSGDKLGCDLGRGLYKWRPAGFGSNINNLLNSWVYGLVVEGWSDLAVKVDTTQLPELECSQQSGGLASRGWSCLFSSMPHVCTFNSTEMWKRHLISAGGSGEDQQEADRISLSLDVIRKADLSKTFQGLDIKQRVAKAVMAKLLWSHMTPWLRKDVRVVTNVRETFERSPFIGIHIRRGDKISGEDHIGLKKSAEAYLAAAVRYFDQEANGISVDDIKGIWVASDDATVVNEVRTQVHWYFPSVLSEDIVYVAGGVPGAAQFSRVATESNKQEYASFVYLLADLEQLAAADVFVGTCSSNVGRLVMLLRDGLGKQTNSGISLDEQWNPSRRRRLALD